jgi:hypothetical protein
MEGDERPQKMRKLSHDHEESQVEVETAKNGPDATNSNGEQTLCAPMVLWPQMLKILPQCQRTS